MPRTMSRAAPTRRREAQAGRPLGLGDVQEAPARDGNGMGESIPPTAERCGADEGPAC